MKLVTRTAAGALVVLFNTVALAEEPTAATQVAGAVVAFVARDGGAEPHDTHAIGLDRYVGRYEAARGTVFFVDRDGDSLTIEVPADLGGAILRLRGDGERDSFATGDGTRVVFRSDATGRVTDLAFHAFGGSGAVAAQKAPERRGIVTVYELPSSPDVAITEVREVRRQ